MHNAAFEALGIDMAYVALPVAAAGVGDAVRGLTALGFRGANVTMPHKASVIPFLDAVTDEARRAGAVNTIVVDEGRATGANTDIGGFTRALREVVPEGLERRSALLLGAGGAARAAALALLGEQVSDLVVANRSADGARRLVDQLSAGPGRGTTRCEAVALSALEPEHVAAADVVVNATALGMEATGKVPAVLTDNIVHDQIVFDLVYKKRPTRLLETARACGARAIDGRAMLVWQAALAFELWTARTAPLAVMRAAVQEG
jgi:shikimate dehydrogenase